jgi:hypothetical protein
MTLDNMRQNGVRTLAIWCSTSGCNHEAVIDVSGFADHVLVPSEWATLRSWNKLVQLLSLFS